MDTKEKEQIIKRYSYGETRNVNTLKIMEAIQRFGSGDELADFLGVRLSTVMRWIDRLSDIDPIACLAIEDKVGVKAIDILPDFPWEKIGYHKRYNS